MLKLHRLVLVLVIATSVLVLSIGLVEIQNILSRELELRYVATDSMYPSIPRNSIVLITDSDGWDYAVGDVVFFNYCAMGRCIPVLHRVIDIEEPGIVVTKGDNRVVVEQVEQRSVRGRFVAGIPYLYGLVQLISFDVVAVAVIAALAMLIPELYPRRIEKK